MGGILAAAGSSFANGNVFVHIALSAGSLENLYRHMKIKKP